MTHIIAVANQKGGTGKTTTTLNLAGALAELDQKMLVIDIDPQGSLGVGFGINVADLETNIYDVIVEGEPITNILHKVRNDIDLAPANIQLSRAEPRLVGAYRREDRLKNSLSPIQDQYDYILIDCPPSLGMLTINALAAAAQVLIPMSCDYYSLVGVRLLLETIVDFQSQVNANLSVLGVVPTRYDSRTRHAQEILEDVRSKLGQHYRVFNTVIKESVRLKEAPVAGLSITEYDGRHFSAEAYRELAQEVLAAYE